MLKRTSPFGVRSRLLPLDICSISFCEINWRSFRSPMPQTRLACFTDMNNGIVSFDDSGLLLCIALSFPKQQNRIWSVLSCQGAVQLGINWLLCCIYWHILQIYQEIKSNIVASCTYVVKCLSSVFLRRNK